MAIKKFIKLCRAIADFILFNSKRLRWCDHEGDLKIVRYMQNTKASFGLKREEGGGMSLLS